MNILKQREQTHGDYNDVARVSQALKSALRHGPIEEVPAVIRESLELICMKMARIVCGDHNEPDHYVDIKGYAELALQKHVGVPSGSSSIQEPDDEPTDASIGDDWDYDPYYRPRSGLPR